MSIVTYTLSDIATILEGTVEGDGTVTIMSASKIDEAKQGDISFLTNPKYTWSLYNTGASAVLVADDLILKDQLKTNLVRVEDVNLSMQKLLDLFAKTEEVKRVISPLSIIDSKATISDNVSIGEFCRIGSDSIIGEGCNIYPQVYIGDEVSIGSDCKIYPGVRIADRCVIGDRVIIHPNAVIGSDGFGFVPDERGVYQKVEQAGNVIIEDDVEIGSNTVIDRATLGSTIIRTGVKLDNLIQIAHNVEIKQHTVIAAQTGVAGSTIVGANSQIGGQVGIVGHLKLANGIKIQAQSGVASAIEEENSKWYGSPAIGYLNYLKSFAIFKKLPQLQSEVQALKQQLNKLLKSRTEGQDI